MSDIQDKKSSGKVFFEDISEWQQTFDAIPDLILVIDSRNKIVMANKAVEKKLSLQRSDIIGKSCFSIMHCTDSPPSFCPHPKSCETGEEHFAEAFDNNLRGYFMFSATPLFNAAGRRIGTVEVARDMSDRKQTEEALQESENIFRSITESATDAIVSVDREDNIVLWNQTAEKIFGYSAEEAIGNKLTIIMPEQHRRAHRKGISRYVVTGKSKVVGKNYEVTALRKDGTEFPVELSLSSWKRRDDIFFTAIIRDITRRKILEQKLREASLTDELTGLLNRRGFMALAEKQLQISKRYKRSFSVLFLDLNEMKNINDSFGHHAGDQALTEMADLLKKTFRSSDILARLGGDEFTVLINEPDPDYDETILNNFIKHLQTFNDRSARPYKLSTSLGMAHFDPSHPKSINELLAEADKLMYEHKNLKLDETSSMISNISKNGICAVTPYMLEKDNMYNVKIHSKNSEMLSLSAVVVWSASMRNGELKSSDRYETGLKFIELDQKRKNTLNKFISSLSTA